MNTRNLTTKVIVTSILIVGMVIMSLVVVIVANCDTVVNATVGKVIDCSGGGTVNVDIMNSRNSATKTYTMGTTTNSVDGLNITSSEINSLTRTDEMETIAYTSSAVTVTVGTNVATIAGSYSGTVSWPLQRFN